MKATKRVKTAVAGVKVGHWTDLENKTGVTVVLFENGATCSGFQPGGAPGTREYALLSPENTVSKVWAVCICGGSAFGLCSVDGVIKYLKEKGKGFTLGNICVPVVPAAVIFDLDVGKPVWPSPEAGYKACLSASEKFDVGRVGAGTGAMASKGISPASPSGVGFCEVKVGSATVSALTVANPFGKIIRKGNFPKPANMRRAAEGTTSSTVISVIWTDASLDKASLRRVAIAGAGGIAQAVFPAFTPLDGDTIFACSTGAVRCDNLIDVCTAAQTAVRESILSILDM